MKRFKLVHVDLNKKYKVITKSSRGTIKQVCSSIKTFDPQIISFQNTNFNEKVQIGDELKDNYYFYDNESEITIIKKDSGIFYDGCLDLSEDVLKQLNGYGNINSQVENCHVCISSFNNEYLTYIDSKMFFANRKYQLEQLSRVLQLHQNNETDYKTKYQILISNFKKDEEVDAICSKNNLTDLYDSEFDKHILVSDLFDVYDKKHQKVKIKKINRANIYTVELTGK